MAVVYNIRVLGHFVAGTNFGLGVLGYFRLKKLEKKNWQNSQWFCTILGFHVSKYSNISQYIYIIHRENWKILSQNVSILSYWLHKKHHSAKIGSIGHSKILPSFGMLQYWH